MERNKAQQNDHDLLIRIDENVKALSANMRRMEENLVRRVSVLEADQVTKINFEELEKRVARSEAWLNKGLGALAIIQIVVGAVIAYILNKI